MLFGYHNHAHEFTPVEGVLMYDYMLEHTNPEYVFFQMDVYWTVMGRQSPVEYFQKYPGRFTLLHIKDHKELGQSGMVGFDAIFNHLATAGTKYLIVEVEQYSYAPAESVKISLDYLLNCPLVK
jgi:sugar phosphate isomerase/epimerase